MSMTVVSVDKMRGPDSRQVPKFMHRQDTFYVE